MSRVATSVVALVLGLVAAFVAGNLSGLYFYPRFYVDHDEHTEAELSAEGGAVEESEEEEEEHVALTKQAFENLGLKLGTATQGEYWKSLTVPGEVIDVPGKSDLSVPAPLTGFVEQVLVRQGQSVGPSQPLLTIRITDESLVESQLQLLATLARLEIVREEIARLAPLTDTGAVSGRAKRDLEYELKQLVANQHSRMQEITARGLPKSALDEVVQSRTLAEELTVSVPNFADSPPYVGAAQPSADSGRKDYSIERLGAHPGKAVVRGNDLCLLSYHADLYIEGAAFESDLPALKRLAETGWTVTAQFGHEQQDGHSHSAQRQGLKLLHVDNHVDRISQTFKFFLPLPNEIESTLVDDLGRTFLQWRFKPGQRVHLRLPVERWENQLIVPIDAVVLEGPHAYVFAEHVDHVEVKSEAQDVESADPKGADNIQGDLDHASVFVELEPIPVRLLHRDSEVAVLADDGQIAPEDRIALNHAFKLHLAMKMQSGGDAAHHHHDH